MVTATSQQRLSRKNSPLFGSLLAVLACVAAGSSADASTTHSYVYGGPGSDEHFAAAPTSAAWTYADASANGTVTASTDFGLMEATLDIGGGAGNSPIWRAISEFTDYVTVRSTSLADNTPVQVAVDFLYSGSWAGTNIGCGCGLPSSYGNWSTSISVDQGAVNLHFADGAFVGGATGSVSNMTTLALNTWVGATFQIAGRLDLSGYTNYSNTLLQDFGHTSRVYLSSTSDVTFDADSLHSYLAPVPLPAAAWLFPSAFGLLGGWVKRRAATN